MVCEKEHNFNHSSKKSLREIKKMPTLGELILTIFLLALMGICSFLVILTARKRLVNKTLSSQGFATLYASGQTLIILFLFLISILATPNDSRISIIELGIGIAFLNFI